MKLRSLFIAVLFGLATFSRAEPWVDALSRMPLVTPVRELNRTNCVDVLLRSFGSNETVRALVVMPGATDELFFFHRVKAVVTSAAPTLLDAVSALTNQTYIRVGWRPPMLLLHTQEDDLEPLAKVENERTAAGLRERQVRQHVLYTDLDWDHLMPMLDKQLKVGFRPWKGKLEANHFYRHNFAAWNLNGWETLEAVALAGKTTFTVQRGRVVFEGDERKPKPPPGQVPPLESFDKLFRGAGTDPQAGPAR